MKVYIAALFVLLFASPALALAQSTDFARDLESRLLERVQRLDLLNNLSLPSLLLKSSSLALDRRPTGIRTPVPTPAPIPAPVPKPAPVPPPSPAPTPKPPPAPTPPPMSDAQFIAATQAEVFRLTNIERTKAGLSKLKSDSQLDSIARAHSADMLANNYFNHTDLTGCSPDCRLKKAGYAFKSYGENIFEIWGFKQTPAEAAKMVVDGWMNSAGHRANILNATLTNTGLGLARSGTTLYVTALYTLPL